MVNVVKPGSCLANSTVLMMHLVDNSLNLSQRLTSRETRCSELLLCRLGQRTEGKETECFFKKPFHHRLSLDVTFSFCCGSILICIFALKCGCLCMLIKCWVCVPWCIFPADRGRETCRDGPGGFVQSSALYLLTGRRSLPPPASSLPSSSSFCHFAPLMVEEKMGRFSSEL